MQSKLNHLYNTATSIIENIPQERYVKLSKLYVSYDDLTEQEHSELYLALYGPGSSGSYNSQNRANSISTFQPLIKILEQKGFKNLKVDNGGDDDILVVDTVLKEFLFFEDYVTPCLEFYPNLKEAWLQSFAS